MAWILRGLRDGIVTTRYPTTPRRLWPRVSRRHQRRRTGIQRQPTPTGQAHDDDRRLADLCPTGAIETGAVESGASGQAPAQR